MSTGIIYVRVSDERQVENFSLGTQEKACREWCEREGVEILRVFREEGVSAKSTARPAFRAALAYSVTVKPDLFVVHSVNRFARNSVDHATTAAALKRGGTTLRSVTEPIDDTATGRLMESILSGFAQFDNDIRAEKTTAGMKAKIASGGWPWQPPVGYLPGMTHDPEAAPIVAKAFDLAASGDFSGPELLSRLLALGLRGRRGGPLSKQTLFALLRNPLYAGIVRARSWGGPDVEATFQPIVTKETFFRVQTVLAESAKATGERRRSNPDFPLRRSAICSQHRKPLLGAWARSKSGKLFGYYRCSVPGCVNASKPVVEARFEETLAGFSFRPGLLRLFREIVVDAYRREHADAETRREAKARAEEAARAKRKWAETCLVEEDLTPEAYREQLTRIEAELDLVVGESIVASIDERTLSADLAFAEVILRDLRKAWLAFGTDVGSRQRFQKILFPRGVVVGRAGEVEPVEVNAIILAVTEAGVRLRESGGPNGNRTRAPALKEPCPNR
jgi:site-specific DNA recombinase